MVSSPKLRVVVASPYDIGRQSLAALITQRPGFSVLASVGYGVELAEEVRRTKPDVLLIEKNGSDSGWVSGLRNLSHVGIAVKALLISDCGAEGSVLEGIEFGLRGVVPRDASTDMLFKSIRCVSAGEYWLGRDRVAGVMDYLRRVKNDSSTSPEMQLGLTTRECDVIRALLTGAGNKDIARSLAISHQAVRHHLCSIFQKLGVSNRLELVLFVFENGLFAEPARDALPGAS